MDSPPRNPGPARLWSLDVFRGICALSVFLCHWHLWSNFAPAGRIERFIHEFFSNSFQLFVKMTWNTGGNHPAVIGFFVLSGFCIHASQCRDGSINTPVNWRAYFWGRARRIMPVYWCASLLGLGFVLLQTRSPAISPLLDFHAQTSPLDVVLRLGGLSGLYPKEVLAGNYTLSTVATELVIYAFYPMFLFCARREAWKTMAALAVLGQLAIIQLVPLLTPFWVYCSPPMMGAFWYAGALAARWFFARPRRMSPLAGIACWMAFLAVREIPVFYARNILLQLIWCAVCVYALLWLACLEQAHPVLSRHSWVRALRSCGLVSYSLYAVHTPVIMLVIWGMLKVPVLDQSYGLQLLLTLLGTLAATLGTYQCVERRYFRNKAKPTGLSVPVSMPTI